MAIKNLLTFGCSFTKDNFQHTWADILAERYNLRLFNLAERGAGSDFVIRRLMSADIDPSQSLVCIMWPSADRYDLWADDTVPHLVNDQHNASWVDGSEPKLVDYYGRYSIHEGFNLNGSVPRGYKHYFYKFFYSAHQAVHNWYINIITAQLYLANRKIDYVMASAFPLICPIHYHHGLFRIVPEIYRKIDVDRFVDGSEEQGFYHYCLSNDLGFYNTHYPSTDAHHHYVNTKLRPKIELLLQR